MDLLTRRNLFTLAIPAVAATAVCVAIPKIIGPEFPKARRVPERINFYIGHDTETRLGIKGHALLRAMQTYVDDYLGPAWGVAAELSWSGKAQPGVWNVVFVDSDKNDVYGAIAYHDFDNTKNLFPDALVDIGAAHEYARYERISDADGVGIAVTHELAEMLVNPGTNNWAGPTAFDDTSTDPLNSQLYALEVCDPVERAYFKVDGVAVSDFVFPAYFEPWRDSGPVDYLGVISKPGEVAGGGYQIVRDHEAIQSIVNNTAEDRRCFRFRRLWNTLLKQGYKVR